MIRRIINLYRFTLSEQKSLMLLCFLLIFLNGINYLIRPEPELAGHVDNLSNESSNNIEGSPGSIFSQDEEHKPIARQIQEDPIVEINSSDSSGLLSLYGIGPVFAGRIIKYRNLLGGYFSCDQLLEVYGMDSLRYEGFRSKIRVDTTAVAKMNINTSSFKELLKHPYLDYDDVKNLVQYRDRKGPLPSLAGLWTDSVLSENLRIKILPYLKCE